MAPWMVALAWGLLSFFGFIAASTALLWPLAQLESAFGLSHVAMLGVWAFAWVIGSGLLALVAARLVFGAWREVRLAALLVLAIGALLSAMQIMVLADWTIARLGYFDPEMAGPTSLLFGIVAGVAVAGFGALLAPRWAAWSQLIAVVGGALLGAEILLENLRGLQDGIAAGSMPLAMTILASSIYIVAVGVLSLARLRQR